MRLLYCLLFFLSLVTTVHAAELSDYGPKGKRWVKITDIHFLDKTSVKKVKGNIYQGTICNDGVVGNMRIWAYSKIRVDCSSKKAWSYSSNEWIGPMSPANYDLGMMKYVCK